MSNDHETNDLNAQLALFAETIKPYQEPNLPYHNWEWHIATSFEAGMKFFDKYQNGKTLEQPNANNLVIGLAILGHDAGYSHYRTLTELQSATGFDSREAYSCHIVEHELLLLGHDQDTIDEVTGCIMATKRGVKPSTINEKIVRRADLANIASDNYEDFATATRNFREEVEGWDNNGEPISLAQFVSASWPILHEYMCDDEPLWPGDKHPAFSHSRFFVSFYINMFRLMKETSGTVAQEVGDFIRRLAGKESPDSSTPDQEAS